MTARNEAAERLRSWITRYFPDARSDPYGTDTLDEALAAERRATVEALIDMHGCRDSDLGIPCGWHSNELANLRGLEAAR